MASDELNKSQGNSKIVVMTNWQHTEAMPPAFKKLMDLLLKESTKHGEKCIKREYARRDNKVL